MIEVSEARSSVCSIGTFPVLFSTGTYTLFTFYTRRSRCPPLSGIGWSREFCRIKSDVVLQYLSLPPLLSLFRYLSVSLISVTRKSFAEFVCLFRFVSQILCMFLPFSLPRALVCLFLSVRLYPSFCPLRRTREQGDFCTARGVWRAVGVYFFHR